VKPRTKRLIAILGGLAVLGIATALVLRAFDQNLVFFFTPTQVAANEAPKGRLFRIGGMVEQGSVKRDGVEVRFVVTDTAKTIPVVYRGPLPDLFREGKGVVAQACSIGGDGVFQRARCSPSTTRTICRPRRRHAVEAAQKGAEDGGEMIPELGQLALSLALAVALVQAFFPLAGAHNGKPRLDEPGAAGRAGARAAGRVRLRLPRLVVRQQRLLGVVRGDSIRTARCRRPIASPACGAATRARSCCGA
jgi:cytochrome c-type biogenesis protein CcmE